ncbi:unnamed protein product [Periconia digitata]|uniref:Uncharacterized protein n=1 Tax=Periconia digitata TaxID=1303443 RepID=A0A9W4UKT2_9PLEO|nr:unnamed protein product [Periconia digitata]
MRDKNSWKNPVPCLQFTIVMEQKEKANGRNWDTCNSSTTSLESDATFIQIQSVKDDLSRSRSRFPRSERDRSEQNYYSTQSPFTDQ